MHSPNRIQLEMKNDDRIILMKGKSFKFRRSSMRDGGGAAMKIGKENL